MIETLNTISRKTRAAHSDIIDVRSPAEFAADHIPGAINLPVLSDSERAETGTIYKQDSRFLARKTGAAYIAANVARHLQGPLKDRSGDWHPLIYCWRGGMRSGGMATILSQIGWRVSVLEGGYRTWRREVTARLYTTPVPWRLVLLQGNTGTGKTEILNKASARGMQTLDLEGLANHRGSLLGGFFDASQPTQKMFESRILARLEVFDPARPVLVEAESSKIGRLSLPPMLWQAMRGAQIIEIKAPLSARADYLVRAYADILADKTELIIRLQRLKGPCSKALVDEWCALARAGAFAPLAASLMQEHYDKAYGRWREGRAQTLLGQIDGGALDSAALEAAADKIAALLAA